MNIEQMARDYGLTEPFINKLNLSNKYITDSATQDRNMINSQVNQTISDYNREKETQNQNLVNESQAAYIDYAKSINPYSTQRSNAQRIGLGDSGYSESSLIGANNTYQNRYTQTKNNFDNIFAGINNNIAKARETGNIELAKIAKAEQDRLLENLWRTNDEFKTEQARAEEQRRYEQQLSASSSSSKSGGGSGGSGGSSLSASLSGMYGSGDAFGNNSDTVGSNNYYFKNSQQPRFVNNTELIKSGSKVSDLFSDADPKGFGGQSIWQANGKYYVWDGGNYIDVTSKYSNKIVNKAKLSYWWNQ